MAIKFNDGQPYRVSQGGIRSRICDFVPADESVRVEGNPLGTDTNYNDPSSGGGRTSGQPNEEVLRFKD